MRYLRAADRFLGAAIQTILVLSFVTMLALAALQVVLRVFFQTGVVWGDEAARNLVIWVGFFGAALASRQGKHFHVDAIGQVMPARLRRVAAVTTDLFAAGVCVFLVRAAATFVTVGIDAESVAFLGISQRAMAMIVPVGFGLVGLQCLLRAVFKAAGRDA